MKIYGVGLFHAPGSSRVVWDFIDGPFDTVNPVLIQEAKKRGYSFTPIVHDIKEESKEILSEEPKDTPKGRGRPKGVKNVNAKINGAD
jgi:hypothetical protein